MLQTFYFTVLQRCVRLRPERPLDVTDTIGLHAHVLQDQAGLHCFRFNYSKVRPS